MTGPVTNNHVDRSSGNLVQAGYIDSVHFHRVPRPARTLLVIVAICTLIGVSATSDRAAPRPAGSTAAKACLVRTDLSTKSGYVWASLPTENEYRPSDEHQCNSSGGTNSVVRDGVGSYTVAFPGLGVDGGTVELSTADAADRLCSVRDWGPSRTDQLVRVTCVDRAGAPADAAFTLGFLFTMTRIGVSAYVRADDPSAATQVPDANHQHNSTGGVNSIDREHTGSHVVFLPGVDKALAEGLSGGMAKVTALGPTPNACSLHGWRPWHNPETGKDFLVVRVTCTTPGGDPVDAPFALSFTADLGSSPTARVPGAYLWADKPGEAAYTPTKEYQYNSTHALNTVTRSASGTYTAHLPGLARKGGHVQVSAYRTTATCGVTGWRPAEREQRVDVVCRAPTGEPVDAQFALVYLG
ncbi:hypothetical protein AB0A74_00675 [Saccharothrix sp. NPDC042600]|uniref:hypothetical protein n=1 Tax=Saccharothrix TaxID=2071 RepID=UPI00340717EC